MKKIADFATARRAEPRGRTEWGNPLRAGAKRRPFSGPDETEARPLPNGGDSAGLVAPKDALGRGPDELERLFVALGQAGPETNPRTYKLVESSSRKIAQKVIEEAGEVAIEAVRYHANGVVRESADLLYHLVILWHRAGIEPSKIWEEMRARAEAFGIAEKLPKTLGRKGAGANPNP
jgi:phosphoribosyl-ATP pyrophosphohydrolase